MKLITLENKSSVTLIDDLIMYPHKINEDETGILVETLRSDWPEIYNNEDRKFAMQYYSKTNPGIARDEDVWHFHPTGQEDRFLVVEGSIVVAVGDQREGSSTKGVLNLFLMESAKDPYMILIPKRTLHGFMVVSKTPAILLNFPTRVYNPEEEGRIPYQEAKVTTDDGDIFTWDLVRKHLNLGV